MEDKAQTKRTRARKTTLEQAAVEPFAEAIDPAPAGRTDARRRKAAAAKPASKRAATAKPVTKKTARKKVAPAAIDPFAEIATSESATEPVKKAAPKRSARTASKKKGHVSAVVSAPTDTAKPVKKMTVKKAVKKRGAEPTLDVTAELAATEPAVELSPVFKALAEVKLPDLARENRARLQMQSPTRLYLYWSLKENPWQQLRRVFGDDLGAYTLVIKLIDLTQDIEHIYPCESEGNWWFAAEPGTEYQAEIGFYATNRPYFRVLHSNTIMTPLRSPSPHPAEEARWTVSATKFAEVLDASGFARDAFDVALAGDDVYGADRAAYMAFSRVVGNRGQALDRIAGGDIRYALAALASGTKLDDLRWQIDERLFAVLEANVEKLTAASAEAAMGEYFDIDESEFDVVPTGSTVFGASLVHFPQKLRSRHSTRYNPVSSHAPVR